MPPADEVRCEPDLDREKAARLTGLLEAVRSLDAGELAGLQRECEQTLPARSAAAAVLADGLAATPGWRYQDAAVRFPQTMRLLNETTRGDAVPHLPTPLKAALVDAMVAVVWREYADTIGTRLVSTLTAPFRGLGAG